MKTFYVLAVYVLIAGTSHAQRDDQHLEKDKYEKGPKNPRIENDQVMEHERTIWAGTKMDLNNKSKDVKNIPDAVLTSFRQFFPNQQIDNVRKYRGLYAITFSNDIYTTTMIYKADGTFVEARTVATDSILPSAIKEKVKGLNNEYDPNEIVMIEKPNKEKFYRLHLKANQRDRFAVYDEQGREVNYHYY
jgi:hypothetical protein